MSLIPYAKNSGIEYSNPDLWILSHSFVARGFGDSAEHAVLLCCLFLGFGLDAYVCIGTSLDGPHVWVLTRNIKNDKLCDLIFWESTSCQRFEVDDPRVQRHFRTIDCLFSDKEFFANIQQDNKVFVTNFDLTNEAVWKRIPSEIILQIPKWNFPFQISEPFVQVIEEEKKLEKYLKMKISEIRMSKISRTIDWINCMG